MTVEVEDDKKGKHQSFTSHWHSDVLSGMGTRNVDLTGWGATEQESRWQLLIQAKVARDELNSAIEIMMHQIIEKGQ